MAQSFAGTIPTNANRQRRSSAAGGDQLAIDFSAAQSAPQRRWTVYVISDPRTSVPAYVGCTVSPLHVRLGQHMHDACGARPVKLWLELLRRAGHAPNIDPYLVADDERTALALERSTIQRLAAEGVDLLNTMHAQGRRAPTLAHVRLWSLCQYDWRAFCDRFEAEGIGSAYRRAIWLGYCPNVRTASEIEETLGVGLHEWLTHVKQAA